MPVKRPAGSIQRGHARLSLHTPGICCGWRQSRPSAFLSVLKVGLNGWPDMLKFNGNGGPFLTRAFSSCQGAS